MRRVALCVFLTAFVFQAGTPKASFGADTPLRPFILASQEAGTAREAAPLVREKLTQAGFEILGEYEPYAGALVLAVTSDEVKQGAAGSQHGGYGAIVRVSLTEAGDEVQIAYTNPTYMAHVYRLNGDAAAVTEKLGTALGHTQDFGSKDGLKEKKLRKYHYMALMPYFDDHKKLASFDSHVEAVEAVEQGLQRAEDVSKVYRVEIPGKEEVLFGAAILGGDGGDEKVMSIIDTGELRHTSHLPYEILVSGKEAYALHGKFRIALNFPDLGMGTFMKISGAPKSIEKTLRAAIKGE